MNVTAPARRFPIALCLLASAAGGLACATTEGAGANAAAKAAQEAIGARAKGKIVWSSALRGNHDLYVMNTDGSGAKPITEGDTVDWFPRFSPDGTKILFTRSKKGWVYERDSNTDNKWDVWTVTPEGQDATKVVDNASWANWLANDEIIFVRGTRIFRRKLAGTQEVLVMDSTGVAGLEGALLQQPQMSTDGKYVAITLRGSKRETGIWDIAAKTWTQTGLGCQINWTPDGSSIYWVNPTGNGGSEIFRMPMRDGKPVDPKAADDTLKFMDLPGRISHEYFPKFSADGKWLVWAATQRGHDHDIADYEIHLWEIGTPPESAVRLTYQTVNDRWPDIFIPGAALPVASPPPAAEPEPAAVPATRAAPEKKPRARKR